MTVLLLNAPSGVLTELPDSLVHRRRPGPGIDVAALFETRRSSLDKRLPGLAKSIFPGGALWVAWPKRTSGVPTEINENTIRDVALPTGLVDNKVCAIDEIWSGLRLVWRKERRI